MGLFSRRGKKVQVKQDASKSQTTGTDIHNEPPEQMTSSSGTSEVTDRIKDMKIKSILKKTNSFSPKTKSLKSSIVSSVWKLTQIQMEECEDVFSLFADENQLVHDKHVGKMFQALGCDIDKEDLNNILEKVKQKGGKMDFSTFAQSVAPHIIEDTNQVYYSEENIKLAFERFDLDKDGFISASELRHALTDSFCQGMKRVAETLDDADIEEVMAEADLDGDGRINLDEFRTMIPYLSVGIEYYT